LDLVVKRTVDDCLKSSPARSPRSKKPHLAAGHGIDLNSSQSIALATGTALLWAMRLRSLRL
jgi:hypothetical protein